MICQIVRDKMKTIKLAGNIVDEKDISSSTCEEVTFSSTILPANFKERFSCPCNKQHH